MTSQPSPRRPLNSCQKCGATSYGPIIARSADGALRPSGRYRCTGCDVVFENAAHWRGKPAAAGAPGTHASPAGDNSAAPSN